LTPVQRAWRDLADVPATGDGWKTQRIHPEAPCPVRAAIREPGGMPAVLIEVAAPALRSVAEYPSGRGFQVIAEPIRPGPAGEVRLCLVLTETAYADVFGTLADDVASNVAACGNAGEAVARLLLRLYAWQAIMRRHADGLTEEEQTGLFAELLFLGQMIGDGMLPGQALEGWKGPEDGLRDFVFGGCEVEIKASVGTSGRFAVACLDQLDDGPSDLILAYTRMQEAAGGLTLPELVLGQRRAIIETEPGALPRFNALLSSAGYLDVHGRRYTGRRLAVRDTQYFSVRNGFPRITRSAIPAGVVDARYIVDIQACAPFAIAAERALGTIRGRGGGTS
jgi:hypothetical protein